VVDPETLLASCSCLQGAKHGSFCKHAAALLLSRSVTKREVLRYHGTWYAGDTGLGQAAATRAAAASAALANAAAAAVVAVPSRQHGAAVLGGAGAAAAGSVATVGAAAQPSNSAQRQQPAPQSRLEAAWAQAQREAAGNAALTPVSSRWLMLSSRSEALWQRTAHCGRCRWIGF